MGDPTPRVNLSIAARLWFRIRLALVLGMLAIPLPAAAALGGDISTIAADQQQIRGTLRVSSTARYAIHEIQGPTSTTVREYVSPAGQVFGIAWRGPFMPDLRQVLGDKFDTYVGAMANRRVKGPVLIDLPGLVVHASGRMRNFSGRAYVPGLVPEGVAPEEIQ